MAGPWHTHRQLRQPHGDGGSASVGSRLVRRVAVERRVRGLTQAQVAMAMGVRQSVVSEIESGAIDLRLSTLERYIAAVTGGDHHLEIATQPDIDRTEIRRAVRMSDADRERYYLGSLANMLKLFDEARPR